MASGAWKMTFLKYINGTKTLWYSLRDPFIFPNLFGSQRWTCYVHLKWKMFFLGVFGEPQEWGPIFTKLIFMLPGRRDFVLMSDRWGLSSFSSWVILLVCQFLYLGTGMISSPPWSCEGLMDGWGGSTKADGYSVSFPSPTFLPFYTLTSQNGPEKKVYIR